MFSWIRRLFSKQKFSEALLDFRLDIDDEGKHIVETFATIDDQREKINNVHEIWDYGYKLKRKGKKYVFRTSDLETLLSMRSLNPKYDIDGNLVFDVCPPILRYLRRKGQINESENAKKLKISDKPVKPITRLDYDPKIGIKIEPGYHRDGKDEVISLKELDITKDGGYVKIGDTYSPLPKDIESNVEMFLKTKDLVIQPDMIPDFFKRDIVLLKSKMSVVLTEKTEAINIIDESFKPEIQIEMAEPGWLDFKIEYVAGKYKLPHDIIKNETEKYHHPDDNTWIRTDKKAIKKTETTLKKLGAEETSDGFRVPITHFTSLEEFIEQIGGIRQVALEYQRFLDEITDFKSDENFKLPNKVENKLVSNGINLRPYQRAGIHWITWLTKHHLHGLLADDMGLGKTIQTSASMSLAYDKNLIDKHSLIICPKSVVHFWKREIEKCIPGIRTYEYIGASRNRGLLKEKEPIVFISTYETVTRDISTIGSIPFSYLVLDEATKIKNPQTKRTKAIKSINALHRIGLSGTPIENRASELWSLFDFMMRGHLGTHGGFVRRFEKPIMSGDIKSTKWLSKRIRPFILRRLKEDVAKDIPEKIEMDEWCSLTEEQKSLYGQIQDLHASSVRDAIKRNESVNFTTSILPILTKLKQVCDHPALITGNKEPIFGRSEKFDLITKKIDKICNSGEQVVLFSHFLGTLDLFEYVLKGRNIEYIRIDGSTRDRQALIDKFNSNQARVALCSIRACGYGITLTAANHVIHVDRWWNPATEDQATDRVHRIGQNKTVYVYRILVTGTLEEKIAKMLERKRNLSDRIIGSAVQEKMEWTKEELLELLKPLE